MCEETYNNQSEYDKKLFYIHKYSEDGFCEVCGRFFNEIQQEEIEAEYYRKLEEKGK